jgi:NAD(P)-dependent dehydrogenase (short-subunit alcohol dehydrogenase family)
MERVVFITGASSGIGLETAKLFQSKGWRVAATMRKPEQVAELQRIADIECFRLDVTDPASVSSAISDVLARFGRIDVVVNNAGYGLLGAFEAATPEQVERQFATNVTGLMNVCREVIPYFREQRRGHIVNISSVGGRVAFPFSSLYNSTKWAVEGFTESLSYELGPFNVLVKLIEPGPIKTDFYDRSQDVARKDGLTAYDADSEKLLKAMSAAGETAPDGSAVAEVIFRAVTDGSKKLRYPVNTKGLLTLRRILPEPVFYALVRTIFLR